jgi:hypothetical protein
LYTEKTPTAIVAHQNNIHASRRKRLPTCTPYWHTNRTPPASDNDQPLLKHNPKAGDNTSAATVNQNTVLIKDIIRIARFNFQVSFQVVPYNVNHYTMPAFVILSLSKLIPGLLGQVKSSRRNSNAVIEKRKLFWTLGRTILNREFVLQPFITIIRVHESRQSVRWLNWPSRLPQTGMVTRPWGPFKEC